MIKLSGRWKQWYIVCVVRIYNRQKFQWTDIHSIMPTSLEHLSIELFYEIFSYLQLHELLPTFSNLNNRFTTILIGMPLNRVYVGFNGASLALTQLYHQQLVEDQIRTRLNFLAIFDTTSMDNGAWLASHLHLFVRLRQLILIDIHQVYFESILNVLTCVKDLVRFDVTFTNCVRAMSTYKNVPEGIYHERIFRSLPQLRMCKLHFAVYITSIFDPPPPDDVLPIDSSFFTISSTLDRLQSLSLTCCTFAFLSHLIRRMPQLRVLSFTLSRPWLSNKHSLIHDNIM
jgi:hypothetical protein